MQVSGFGGTAAGLVPPSPAQEVARLLEIRRRRDVLNPSSLLLAAMSKNAKALTSGGVRQGLPS